MNLFQAGEFTLSSGGQSNFKIDCDALSDGDIDTLADIAADWLKTYWRIWPVPEGGIRFAKALHRRLSRELGGPILIVDDVLTTGNSMERERQKHKHRPDVRGVVIFARTPCPPWITPLFQLWEQP